MNSLAQGSTITDTEKIGILAGLKAEQLLQIVLRWGRPFALDKNGYRHLAYFGLSKADVAHAIDYLVSVGRAAVWTIGGNAYLSAVVLRG